MYVHEEMVISKNEEIGKLVDLDERSRRTILRQIKRDASRKRRQFPISPEELAEKIKNTTHLIEDFGLIPGAYIVTIDGPNKSGKTQATQQAGPDLKEKGIEPVYFKESRSADPTRNARRKAFFDTYGLTSGGDPFERLRLVNDVRISALDSRQMQEAISNINTVVFLNRSFITTLAYQLYESLIYEHNGDRTLLRHRDRFLCSVLSEMEGTFFKPDLSLIFQCTPRTTYERMAEKKDMQGKFPPAELHAAYDLIARALTGGDKRHPFGKSYTSDLPISGGNGVYRIVTDLPHNLTRSEELKFYQRIKSFIAETIATDFNATYRLRFDRKNDALNLQKKNKQRVRN